MAGDERKKPDGIVQQKSAAGYWNSSDWSQREYERKKNGELKRKLRKRE